jgi:hypothetical protein
MASDLAQDGSHLDHRAAAITPHRMNAGALRVEDAVEVHTDHLVPGGVTVFSRWLLLAADAGIGHDNVTLGRCPRRLR